MDWHERRAGLHCAAGAMAEGHWATLRRWLSATVCVLGLIGAPAHAAIAADPAQPYQFGVHPYLVPRTMAVAFGPATLDLGEKLHHPVRLLTATSFDKYLDKLRDQEYDIAIVQPFDFPRVVHEFGYLPLARVNAQLRAIFVVLAQSELRGMADLAGKRIAMAPQEAATSRQGLWALGAAQLNAGRNVTVNFLNTHDACLQELLRGAADACVTGPPPLEEFVKRTGAAMRVLAMTDPIPHMAAVVHPRVPAEQREIIRKTMLQWSDSEEGKTVLAAMGYPGWTDLKDGDYAEIERHLGDNDEGNRSTPSTGLVFGTFPYFQPRRVAAHLAPLTEALTALLQQPVRLRTTTSYVQFESNLREQKYDLALINPFEFQLAMASDYEPLVRFGDDLRGHFYVNVTSNVRDLQALRGKTIATPPSTAVLTLLAREHLRQHGLTPDSAVQFDYRPSHDSCLERLLAGHAAACVTSPVTLDHMPAAQRAQLREIDKTEAVPGMALVVHRRHSATIGASMRKELLSWSGRADRRAALDHLGLGDFVAIQPESYLALPAMQPLE